MQALGEGSRGVHTTVLHRPRASTIHVPKPARRLLGGRVVLTVFSYRMYLAGEPLPVYYARSLPEYPKPIAPGAVRPRGPPPYVVIVARGPAPPHPFYTTTVEAGRGRLPLPIQRARTFYTALAGAPFWATTWRVYAYDGETSACLDVDARTRSISWPGEGPVVVRLTPSAWVSRV